MAMSHAPGGERWKLYCPFEKVSHEIQFSSIILRSVIWISSDSFVSFLKKNIINACGIQNWNFTHHHLAERNRTEISCFDVTARSSSIIEVFFLP